MEDNQIIDLYWERKEEAITATNDKYGRYCYSISENILHQAEDSEECVNDTWLHTWNAIPPKRPEHLKLFLARIIRNLAINRYSERTADKRGGQEIDLVLDELSECLIGDSNVEDAVEAKDLEMCIHTFVRTLPVRDANLFARRYFFAESVADIANRYGMNENNAMVILSRTRKKLKGILIKEGFYHDKI